MMDDFLQKADFRRKNFRTSLYRNQSSIKEKEVTPFDATSLYVQTFFA